MCPQEEHYPQYHTVHLVLTLAMKLNLKVTHTSSRVPKGAQTIVSQNAVIYTKTISRVFCSKDENTITESCKAQEKSKQHPQWLISGLGAGSKKIMFKIFRN